MRASMAICHLDSLVTVPIVAHRVERSPEVSGPEENAWEENVWENGWSGVWAASHHTWI